MFGAWSLCLEFVQTEQIPVRSSPVSPTPPASPHLLRQSYYFARDDRVYKAFIDRVEQYKDVIQRKGSKRLKWQIRVLKVALDGRNTTYNVRQPSVFFPSTLIAHSFRRIRSRSSAVNWMKDPACDELCRCPHDVPVDYTACIRCPGVERPPLSAWRIIERTSNFELGFNLPGISRR